MTEPKRLSTDSGNELERVLLRAGRARAPEGARRRALVAASGVAATSGLAASTAAAGGAVAKTGSLVALKWVTVVGLAGLGAAAATGAVHERLAATGGARVAETHPRGGIAPTAVVRQPTALRYEPGEPAAVVLAATEPADERAPAPAAPAPVSIPTPAAGLTPTLGLTPTPAPTSPQVAATQPLPRPALAAQRAVPAEPAAPPELASNHSMLPAELAELAHARGALASGEPAQALAILDAYARRFPEASLSPEASVLRIEALVDAGDRSAAQRAADAFAASHPDSPYAARIRALLGGK